MIKIKNKEIPNGIIFFLLVIFVYLGFLFINPSLISESFEVFFDLLIKIAPVLIFVFALMFGFNLFIKPKTVQKYLGQERGFTGWLVSIVGGIISMGAIYMWYPLLADLRKKGMSDAFIVAFLYNRSIKLPLLPFLVYYFGFNFTVILTVLMILFSIINGFLVDKIINKKS
ncbi:MAG TPA: permease [Candidatus Paceibacterota bacterium]|nr:permease [Candidatus Paceibacterota bacterium]